MIGALTFATFAITLDGKPALPRVRAADADGRVLLPVRALGEALGADVSYDGAAHRIVVQRGARVASLSSRGAVRVVHGRAYAPLRATAAAFGLGVSYEGAARTVALQSPRTRGGAMGPPISSQASFPPGLRVASTPVTPILTPGAGAAIHSVYPSISARFPGMTAIDPGSLRLLLDGRDVSRDAAVIGDEVLYTPRSALPPGAHAVALDARAINGTPLHVAWDFQDSFAFAPAVAPTPFPITAIYLDRWVTPGTNAFDVIVRGAPGLTGYVGVDGVGGYFPLSVLA
ncbi:MAG: copper amine oxidase N-terminal domain-containing protein, partial [Candidatus Eremiobacteraeota bacterium]|nr:copper amine oxidase N-terminal domain-containing protein [Candidatus Eremiobacteraeota bacterium]